MTNRPPLTDAAGLVEEYRSALRPLLAASGRPVPPAALEDLPCPEVRARLAGSEFVRALLADFGHAGGGIWDPPQAGRCRFPSVESICEEYRDTEYGPAMLARGLFPLAVDGGGCLFLVDVAAGTVHHMTIRWSDRPAEGPRGTFENNVAQTWPTLGAFCGAVRDDGPWTDY